MATLGRPPIITVLGHVDHGKTSLLDRIRQANVATRELGGITQAIGAYQITHHGQKLTFIDTPGHAAFSAMRARGGKVADLAFLVVAADDGVMPQTKESIKHIKAAGIPYLVVVNKIDLPQANVLKVKADLAEAGEYVEGYGGNIPLVEVSAKTGFGIDSLLETVLLLAELEELKDTSREPTSAVVIESQLHPHQGPLATLLIKTGQLAIKNDLYLGTKKVGKVRAMTDADGVSVSLASTSTPVQVSGFEVVPPVGSIITSQPGEAVEPAVLGVSTPQTEASRPNILVKADVAGSLEAILNSLSPEVNLITASVGAVTESDVQLAATNQATIICFNVKVSGSVAKLATLEKVNVVTFGIIYELFDYVQELVTQAQTQAKPEVLGELKVIKTFPFDKKTVFGCLVLSGKVRLGDTVNGSKITSIRIGKEIVKEAKKDQECGLLIEPALDYKVGDVIIIQSS